MFCMNCGHQLPDGAKFCLNCGTPQGSVSPTGSDSLETINLDGTHSFVPARCPNCSANMKVDASLKLAKCGSCGTECLVQEAVKQYNSVVNVDVLKADVVNVQSVDDYVVEAGVLIKYKGSDVDIKIPRTVKCIGNNVFKGREYINSVFIPDSVERIEDNAFIGCKRIVEIDIPASVSYIGKNAFGYCSSLKAISIPNSVAFLGAYAFENCSSLVDVKLPDNLTEICVGAFSGCSGLKDISIPNNIKIIGDYAFYRCNNLSDVLLNEGLESIGICAFWCCTSLKNILIPNSVKEISGSAFGSNRQGIDISYPISWNTKREKKMIISTYMIYCESRDGRLCFDVPRYEFPEYDGYNYDVCEPEYYKDRKKPSGTDGRVWFSYHVEFDDLKQHSYILKNIVRTHWSEDVIFELSPVEHLERLYLENVNMLDSFLMKKETIYVNGNCSQIKQHGYDFNLDYYVRSYDEDFLKHNKLNDSLSGFERNFRYRTNQVHFDIDEVYEVMDRILRYSKIKYSIEKMQIPIGFDYGFFHRKISQIGVVTLLKINFM